MRLHWNANGHAFDEATGLSAQVECNDPGSAEPWIWFLADWPVYPGPKEVDRVPSGRAATEGAAKAAAEAALPTEEGMEKMRSEAEEQWQAFRDSQDRAAPWN
jgi:hypothetical protein